MLVTCHKQVANTGWLRIIMKENGTDDYALKTYYS